MGIIPTIMPIRGKIKAPKTNLFYFLNILVTEIGLNFSRTPKWICESFSAPERYKGDTQRSEIKRTR